MKSLWHFFRLIRPMNLLVIALTMIVFQKFVTNSGYSDVFVPDFLLLVLSTLLIAASGNIINDYFDVKADRVNKPELLIIDKHIKRRWAIVLNWILNSAGLLIALYLSWKYKIILVAVIPFVCINLLWFYSMYFKRTLILGNVLIAFLTGIVPLYILLYNRNVSMFDYRGAIAVSFAAYAFWLNLIREIVKDMADVEGDRLLNSRTMPISFGIPATRTILFVLYLIAIVPLAYVVYESFGLIHYFNKMGGSAYLVIFLPALALLAIIVSMTVLPKNSNRPRYILSSNLLKLAMFFGLLTPLFL